MTNVTEQEHSVQKLSAISIAVLIAEFAVIVIINAFTIVAFKRNRHLRKRSTYLITNLTVADLLVGAITGPLEFYYLGVKTWNWQELIMVTFSRIFPSASLTNLSLISLDRFHATVYPFRHCLIEKCYYFKIIFCGWLLALLVSSTNVILSWYIHAAGSGFLMSFFFVTLLIVAVSNIIITTKIKQNLPPHPSSAVASERKLSVTLFIVTVASMLTVLPWVVFQGLDTQLPDQLSNYLTIAHVLFYMNSIVNPLIYAIRMQEFRKAVRELVRKNNSVSTRVQPTELQAM